MLRVALFLASAGDPRYPSHECACCAGRFSVRSRGMRLFHGDTLYGEICPDCLLTGPAGAAAKIRARLAALHGENGKRAAGRRRPSLVRLLSRRALLLEGTPSFSLAARQAAVRETRERR